MVTLFQSASERSPARQPVQQRNESSSRFQALIPDTLLTGAYVNFLTQARIFADPIGEINLALRQMALELYAMALAASTN